MSNHGHEREDSESESVPSLKEAMERIRILENLIKAMEEEIRQLKARNDELVCDVSWLDDY